MLSKLSFQILSMISINLPRRKKKKEFKVSKIMSLMMMSLITKRKMNLAEIENIAGFTCKRDQESLLSHSLLSHLPEEDITLTNVLIILLKPFSTTRTTGSTWMSTETLLKSTLSLKLDWLSEYLRCRYGILSINNGL